MNNSNGPEPESETRASNSILMRPARWVRCAVAGVLMGLANLVPGVSGGTMILIMGLYDEFITSLADVTRFRFRVQSVVFLGILACVTAATIAALSGWMAAAVESQPSVMYALFIGLTLGGAPLLWRMAKPIRTPSVVTMAIGFGLMVAIAVSRDTSGPPARHKVELPDGENIETSYTRDFAAGVLGMGAMVLPGISGAFMLLIMGRYEAILVAISRVKEYAMSFGRDGDLAALHVLIPVALGAILSLLVVTNLMKWLLRHYEKATVGFLLGILVGSVVGLWPMEPSSTPGDYTKAVLAFVSGLVLTTALARIGSKSAPEKRA